MEKMCSDDSSVELEKVFEDAFAELTVLPVETEDRRPTCLRCRRPEKVCLCPFLPQQPLDVSTCLYIVQHPNEESRVLRTVPLLAACLPQGKCNVIVGRRFSEERYPDLAAVCQDSKTLILYPGPNAQNLEELDEEKLNTQHNCGNLFVLYAFFVFIYAVLTVELFGGLGCTPDKSQNVYEFEAMASKPEKVKMPDSEEEVTDFFRSSADSSPCTFEPLSRLAEEDEDQPATKSKAKTDKKIVRVAEMAPECTAECPLDDPDWECAFDDIISAREKEDILQPLQDVETQVPVAPPRQKASSLQKFCLDLAPLTPVDIQEEIEAGAKEEREEEKETASPAETADEGDGEEIRQDIQ
ncbi:hypothetical protein WMY93_021220 [Mugilogobius chulae]|uniref:tRNA-uridine aminocarboxypropyltransferase n=1 Tax=Mugilogobius chulae TaxID=88201 RepID=A0AAW0NB81_9GOBI